MNDCTWEPSKAGPERKGTAYAFGPTWGNVMPTCVNIGSTRANFGPTWGQLGTNLGPAWVNSVLLVGGGGWCVGVVCVVSGGWLVLCMRGGWCVVGVVGVVGVGWWVWWWCGVLWWCWWVVVLVGVVAHTQTQKL